MQAIILASGLNTRVQHVHPNLPKAMFPLGDRPYIDHYIENLFSSGVSEIILITYHLAHVIKGHLSENPDFKSGKIKIVERPETYGPVGSIVHIEDMLADRFLLLYCDVLFKTNIKEAYEKLDTGFDACTFITKDSFGMWDRMEIKVDENKNIVTEFNPDAFSKDDAWMDVGQVYNKSVVALLKNCSPSEEHINKNIWPELIKNKKLTFHKVGPVFDYGTEKNINDTREIFIQKGLKALGEGGL